MPSLSNKTVLITGSARGIGAATARLLASQGANVIINYVSAGSGKAASQLCDEINAAGKGGKAISIKADMATIDGPKYLADASVDQMGKIDAVLHNAGIMPRGAGVDFAPEMFDTVYHTNVRGPLLLTQALEPHMPKGGVVVFYSTGLTRLNVAPPDEMLYITTKGAIEQATRCYSKHLGAKGIRVVALAPGPTNTELFTAPKTPEQIAFFENLSPFKRLGQPDEMAKTLAFLISEDASWISGTTIYVNGANMV